MAKKRIVMAIGHKDMGTNLPEQKEAVQRTAKVIADFMLTLSSPYQPGRSLSCTATPRRSA